MKMQSVTSSQVESVGYDAASKTLAVKFKNGGEYQYDGPPPELYDSMLKAESIGKFLGAHVKGKFTFRKVA